MNLVLDDVREVMRGKFAGSPFSLFGEWIVRSRTGGLTSPLDDTGNETTRSLGLVVARGTLLVLISPADGAEEIANPFVQRED
jgi:small nuclear ribonucleoprotein (snRNP)-like protein